MKKMLSLHMLLSVNLSAFHENKHFNDKIASDKHTFSRNFISISHKQAFL